MRVSSVFLLLSLPLSMACGGSVQGEPQPLELVDASTLDASDAPPDAGKDASPDAGEDASVCHVMALPGNYGCTSVILDGGRVVTCCT